MKRCVNTHSERARKDADVKKDRQRERENEEYEKLIYKSSRVNVIETLKDDQSVQLIDLFLCVSYGTETYTIISVCKTMLIYNQGKENLMYETLAKLATFKWRSQVVLFKKLFSFSLALSRLFFFPLTQRHLLSSDESSTIIQTDAWYTRGFRREQLVRPRHHSRLIDASAT